MKKIALSICLMLLSYLTFSQTGLTNLLVEKYYVSNAADAAGSAGTLPVGSVTYRFYAEMSTNWVFQAAYGLSNPVHELRIGTTTSFFNNTDYGSTAPTFSKTNAGKNTVMLDSWLSAGAACAGNFGVFKTEDNGVNNIVNANGLLANTDPKAGIPLTTQDGILAGAPQAVTLVGLDAVIGVFSDGSANGNLFSTTNGSWASLNGSAGPTSNNRVLIAQITTDGILDYKFNIQIKNTQTLEVRNYVAENPVGTEISIPSLKGTLGAPNVLPTVSITAPTTGANYITGDAVTITATAADADGTVSSVEFFVDGSSIGTVTTSPYTKNWTSTAGTHSLTAKATDNDGGQTTSSTVFVNVVNNQPPVVNIYSPTAGSTFNVGSTITISADASDADGTVSKVEFYVNGVKVGESLSSPYSVNWTAVEGTANLTAKATDNRGASTTSSIVNISVIDPSGPPYQITTSVNSCRTADIFCIPIVRTRDALQNCIGFDVVMTYDPNKVRPTGLISVGSDLINPVYTSYAINVKESESLINISAFLNTSAPAGTGFNGTGEVFCVEFSKTTNFKSVDTASFSVTSLIESYNTETVSKLVKDGKYITYKESSFTGSLKFWADNSPIDYDAANPGAYLPTQVYGNNSACNSKSATAVQPDLTGNFNYNVLNGVNINIERDIASATDVQPVINGFDALLTQKVLVDDATFSPNVFQMIAMDVNEDGVISAGDLSQINQRTVKIINEFKQAWNYNNQGVSNGQKSKDWIFVDTKTYLNDLGYRKSSTYPQNDGIGFSKKRVPVVSSCLYVPVSDLDNCTQIGSETYQGILLGDINGNYKSITHDGMLKSNHPLELIITPDKDKVIFDLTKAVTKGNFVEIPVSVTSDDVINSLDFSLQFNEGNLLYDSFIDKTTYMKSLANYNADDKTLRFTSYSLVNYKLGEPLITLRFTKIADKIAPSDIYSVKTYLNGDPAGSEMLTITGISNINKNDNNIKVYPNPATDLLNVEVSERSNIQLFDIDGKQIITMANVNANEKQEINIQNLADGIYMLKVYNDKFVSVKKVVIKK